MGVAPISDPKLVVLVTLYNPTGEGGHQGGVWYILTTHYEIYLSDPRKCDVSKLKTVIRHPIKKIK